MTPRALALASLVLSIGTTAGCGDDGNTDANPPRLWLGLAGSEVDVQLLTAEPPPY